jgi:tetratricopeptide (TPR) repeat protein
MRRLLALLTITLSLHAQQRLASDFEIAQMEKQLSRSSGFEAQLAGRLNLGDVRAARSETQLARDEYARALQLASQERQAARRDSALTRYAQATSYAALAQAKLGQIDEAFALLEESVRYASDDPESWNLYASAMRILGHPSKAVSAGRNAIAIAATKDDALDLAVYQHALATALIEADEPTEAENLLLTLTTALDSVKFAPLREEVARSESFEVYSSARGDVAAYVSLRNRARLRLAALYEKRGATKDARAAYTRVLDTRSDDATALAALARLAGSDSERERHYRAAFEANPFSMPLVREYRRYVEGREVEADASTTGGAVRTAIAFLARGDLRAARSTLDPLLRRFPANETLRVLRQEAEGTATVSLPASASPSAGELLSLLEGFERLTPQQRATLDAISFRSAVRFHALPFVSGEIEGVPFRFGSVAQFTGSFAPGEPLLLHYRVLGVASSSGRDILLLEPLRLEREEKLP